MGSTVSAPVELQRPDTASQEFLYTPIEIPATLAAKVSFLKDEYVLQHKVLKAFRY